MLVGGRPPAAALAVVVQNARLSALGASQARRAGVDTDASCADIDMDDVDDGVWCVCFWCVLVCVFGVRFVCNDDNDRSSLLPTLHLTLKNSDSGSDSGSDVDEESYVDGFL
jgi:hypothetical protein